MLSCWVENPEVVSELSTALRSKRIGGSESLGLFVGGKFGCILWVMESLGYQSEDAVPYN